MKFWALLTVIFFGVLAGRTLLGPGYFNMHDDLQMMRQLEMEKCFMDLQIPCRWVPDMGYGFGFPLFNYYPPLPYLVGQVIRLLGFPFTATVKILFAGSFVVSGITMYFLAKEFFGKLGGALSAIFYIWAPYHSVDVFVRGAMNEAWALMWFPLILLASYKLIKPTSSKSSSGKTQLLIGLGLSWFALMTSHNLMVIIFTPFFALWCLLWLVKYKAFSAVKPLVVSGVLAFGLSAFFVLPVFLERDIVHVDTLVQGYYEFTAHFATINQLLFSRFWGYGPSVWLEDDRMSFQIGHIHWILSLVIVAFVALKFLKKRKLDDWIIVVGFFFAVGWFTAFMAHSRSTPIWQAIKPLSFVQFPWRYLTIVTLSFSFLVGALVKFLPRKIGNWLIGLLVIGLLAFNWEYFKPEHGKLGPLTDQEKFTAAAWDLQQTAGIYDYLPMGAKEAPKGPQTTIADTMEGNAIIYEDKKSIGTNWASFNIDVKSDKSLVRINIYKFPDWKVTIYKEGEDKGQELTTFIPETESWGRMHVEVPEGKYVVYARLYDTPARKAGNAISVVTWIGLLAMPVWQRRFAKKVKKAKARNA